MTLTASEFTIRYNGTSSVVASTSASASIDASAVLLDITAGSSPFTAGLAADMYNNTTAYIDINSEL